MTTTVEEEFDLSLEPEILTSKEQNKTLPCRQCRRPCVVNVFASPAKTECSECRGRVQQVEIQFNDELEPETLTQVSDTKELPCRICQRRCVVNRSASPARVECSVCRGTDKTQTFEFNDELETEVRTDKDQTKELPCTRCKRRCVVTLFKAPATVVCDTCRGVSKHERREKVKETKAASIGDVSRLEHLSDAIMNPVFKLVPLCPFDPEHVMELKSVVHTPHYGPRHFMGYEKGRPKYVQETGESVVYQCETCKCIVNYSTQHPLLLCQNERANVSNGHRSALADILGTREEAA